MTSRRLLTMTAAAMLTVAHVLPAWADDPSPSPTTATTAASDSPSPSPAATPTEASPADEQPADDAGDARAGTWVCSSDGSDCELVRDCQQEAFAGGFDPADYCATPAAEPTVVEASADGDAVDEFPYTPEELDALPDDSPLLTDGGWLAVDS